MKRKIIDAEKSAPEIARETVERVRALYAVERQGKDASVAERLKLRREQSVPLLAELYDRLLAWKQQLLPKHPMAEAINYALGQWNELNVFSTVRRQALFPFRSCYCRPSLDRWCCAHRQQRERKRDEARRSQ
jgi:hypothetical protein